MHKLALLFFSLLALRSSSAFAQNYPHEDGMTPDRIEADVFFDYLGIPQTSTNNFGYGLALATAPISASCSKANLPTTMG